ncbi:MAG: hypothetical protein RLZZ303_2582 [Candidatus Hydrogenedentota bacterium]|jgi:uncharacterized membrane protein
MNLLETLENPSMMHAAVVHFPIVLFLMAVPAAAAVYFLPRHTWLRAGVFFFFVLLAGASYVAEETGEKAYGVVPAELSQAVWDQIHQHEQLAELLKFIAAAGAGLLLISFIPYDFFRKGGALLALCAALAGSILCGVTAHYGGDLVYTHGVGTKLLKDSLVAKPTDSKAEEKAEDEELVPIRPIDLEEAKKVSFTRDIAPIMESRCLDCHDGPDADGAYDVRTVASLLAAGEEHGPGVIPGDADGSPVVKFIRGELRPRMPKRKPPLPEEELHLIRLWIAAGAADDSVVEAPVVEPVSTPVEAAPLPAPTPEPVEMPAVEAAIPEAAPSEPALAPVETAPVQEESPMPEVVEEAAPEEITPAPVEEMTVTPQEPAAETQVPVVEPQPAGNAAAAPLDPFAAPAVISDEPSVPESSPEASSATPPPAPVVVEEMTVVESAPAPVVQESVSEAVEQTTAQGDASSVVKFDPFASH